MREETLDVVLVYYVVIVHWVFMHGLPTQGGKCTLPWNDAEHARTDVYGSPESHASACVCAMYRELRAHTQQASLAVCILTLPSCCFTCRTPLHPVRTCR